MNRIHHINRPLIVGEEVLVPCVDGTPVLWPPHADEETDQPEMHVHADARFDPRMAGVRVNLREGTEVAWQRRRVEQASPPPDDHTPVDIIHPAIRKLKCNAIIDGKCPHKGFNMAQVIPVNGVLTCPLHGMRFHARTGQGIRTSKPEYSEEELWLRG